MITYKKWKMLQEHFDRPLGLKNTQNLGMVRSGGMGLEEDEMNFDMSKMNKHKSHHDEEDDDEHMRRGDGERSEDDDELDVGDENDLDDLDSDDEDGDEDGDERSEEDNEDEDSDEDEEFHKLPSVDQNLQTHHRDSSFMRRMKESFGDDEFDDEDEDEDEDEEDDEFDDEEGCDDEEDGEEEDDFGDHDEEPPVVKKKKKFGEPFLSHESKLPPRLSSSKKKKSKKKPLEKKCDSGMEGMPFGKKKKMMKKKCKNCNEDYLPPSQNTYSEFMSDIAKDYGRPFNEKFSNGMYEDLLLPPATEEPAPGQPGYAPETRLGGPQQMQQVAEALQFLNHRLSKMERAIERLS